MRKSLFLTAMLGTALACAAGCGGGGSGSGGGGGSGTGGSGGTGGSTATGTLLNKCDPAKAEDHTADATTTIAQSGLAYSPPCIKIKAGSSVKFTADFASHPLVGGVVDSGTKTPDDKTPIASTKTGTEATFTFPDKGSFGFYCDIHATVGMAGAVFVE